MNRLLLSLMILASALVATGQTIKQHRDYVPDEKTAETVAEVILVAQFGQERVNEQLPLRAVSTSKDLWLVQGTLHGQHALGGNFGVWINKRTGCLKVVERMK